MARPEFPPLEFQLEQLPVDHLREVPLPRDTYFSIAESLSAQPSITLADFGAICTRATDPSDSNSTLTAEQRLAAFEQLQADGKLTLGEIEDRGGIFGVLSYTEPVRQLTSREARRETWRASKYARERYKEQHGGAPKIELRIGRGLVGNAAAERLTHWSRVAGHAITGTQREEVTRTPNTVRRSDTPSINPAVLAWAQNRQTIAVLQPPAIDLLRPEQIDVRTIQGGELFSRDNLADSIVEIYELYMAGLEKGNYTPKEALAYRRRVAEAHAQELLEGYYPDGIPDVLLTGLTEMTLQFLASREGMTVIREYQGAARDIANAKKKADTDSGTEEARTRTGTRPKSTDPTKDPVTMPDNSDRATVHTTIGVSGEEEPNYNLFDTYDKGELDALYDKLESQLRVALDAQLELDDTARNTLITQTMASFFKEELRLPQVTTESVSFIQAQLRSRYIALKYQGS